MSDIGKKQGNLRNGRENDEGYGDPDTDPFAPSPITRDYTKGYKGRAEVIQLEGIIITETDSAILFKFQCPECDIRQEWFPISQIKSVHRMVGKKDKIVMSTWIASKKGIEL